MKKTLMILCITSLFLMSSCASTKKVEQCKATKECCSVKPDKK